VRFVSLAVLALWLALAGTVLAQSSDGTSDGTSPPPEDQPAPSGPILQPSDNAPVICDPGTPGFRYLEVRGTGFDAWSTQHLIGALVNAGGVTQEQWGSVWVSPQGSLTLEVNLCGDPFQNHGALPAGDYTVMVGQGAGAPIASTGISLAPPAEPGAEPDQTLPADVEASPTPNPSPSATPFQYVIPTILPQATPTPLPLPAALGGAAATAPTATPEPSQGSGFGSQQRPYPIGAPGNLVDGWQMLVTGISPDAFDGIQTDVPSAIRPASDQRDYVVRVQATYVGQGTGVFSSVRLALLSTLTQLTYDQLANSCGTIPDPLNPTTVTQGTTVRGNVCFVVRASDVGSLIAFDNQPTPSDRVFFALQ
jgi:hypothetical protein